MAFFDDFTNWKIEKMTKIQFFKKISQAREYPVFEKYAIFYNFMTIFQKFIRFFIFLKILKNHEISKIFEIGQKSVKKWAKKFTFLIQNAGFQTVKSTLSVEHLHREFAVDFKPTFHFLDVTKSSLFFLSFGGKTRLPGGVWRPTPQKTWHNCSPLFWGPKTRSTPENRHFSRFFAFLTIFSIQKILKNRNFRKKITIFAIFYEFWKNFCFKKFFNFKKIFQFFKIFYSKKFLQ